MKRMRLTLLGSVALPFSMGAQSAPVLQLGKPDATAAAEFTRVVSANELAPGRLLVADEREHKLTLVDFNSGATRSVGRVGAGPGEFRALGEIVPRAKGGAFVTDFILRRLLPVLPDGSIGDPI